MQAGSRADGIASIYLGEFGEAWVKAVAAGCGLIQGHPGSLDLQKADIQITQVGEVAGTIDPTVQVQVKTTENTMDVADGLARFALDRPTFDALRDQRRRTVRRVLAVVWVAREGDRVRLQDDGTLLVGHAAWVSLEGLPASENKSAVTVSVPIDNTIDASGLRRLITEFGVARSTPVPAINPWGTT